MTTLDDIYDVAYSGLTRSWCYALLYENLLQFLKNNCVVFILIVLHLIYLVFKNFWINIIIETSKKKSQTKKHDFSYIFDNGNQQKFSKSTQNSCIIYFRIPVQLEQYFENVEIKINIENLCWKIKSTETLIWPSKTDF